VSVAHYIAAGSVQRIDVLVQLQRAPEVKSYFGTAASLLGRIAVKLLLGAYRSGKLRYVGHSGTGFSEKELAQAIERLRPLFIDKPPVENPTKTPEKIQWGEPKLEREAAFAEWTEDEQLRQTTFLGWRDDKNAELVSRNP
jgi:ATP-dependent DNA ligase